MFLPTGDKWIYALDPKKNYKCIENYLYIGNHEIKLDRPILEASSDWFVSVRTKNKIFTYDFNGNLVSEIKTKSSAIYQREHYLAYSKKKKIEILDLETDSKIYSKKIRGNINSIYTNKERIIVGSSKGLHAFDYDENLIWEIDTEPVNLIKVKDFVLAAQNDGILALSLDGELLWRFNLKDVICIYDMDITPKGIKIYTIDKGLLTLSKNGTLESIEDLHYEYKFLPMPDKTSQRLLEILKDKIKKIKAKDVKSVKKMHKNAKKLVKAEKYGAAYMLLLRALNKLKELQFQVLAPKKVPLGKQFFITLRFTNLFDEPIENIVVDLSDLDKYFDVPASFLELPPIRKESYLERKIGAYPKYEGKFHVKVNVKSNIGEVKRNFTIEVKRRRFLFFREKRKTLLDLLEGR